MPVYKHARPRGFAPWKPKQKALKIVAQVLHILEAEKAYLPLTNRQIFYRLVANFGYSKTEKAAKALGEINNRARRAGMIPWDAIRDDGFTDRSGHFYWSPNSLQYVLKRECRRFLIRPDLPQPCKVEVFVEAAGMVPQVARVANPLGVTVFSSGGFNSVTAKYDTAKRLAQRGKPTVILSIGDYDPSGVALYQSFKEDILAFLEEGVLFIGSDHPAVPQGGTTLLGLDVGMYEDREPPEILFRRIAITPDQIRENGYPTAPRKEADKRGDWRGETAQCEAIPPAQLADIIHEAICEHYDLDAITDMGELCSDELQESLERKVSGLDFSEEDQRAANFVHELSEQLAHHDWTCGYTNEDDDEMEEGI